MAAWVTVPPHHGIFSPAGVELIHKENRQFIIFHSPFSMY